MPNKLHGDATICGACANKRGWKADKYGGTMCCVVEACADCGKQAMGMLTVRDYFGKNGRRMGMWD